MKRTNLVLAVAAALAVTTPVHADPPRSGEVTGVSVIPSPGHAEIVINVRGAVEVKDFVLRDPSRLVVDVLGAKLNGASTLYDGVDRGGILDVRYAQFRPDVVRIVINLADARDYSLDQSNGAIRVSFGAERGFLAWSSTAPADLPVPGPVARPTRSQPEVTPPPEEAPAPVLATAAQQPRITVTWDKADISDVVAGFAAFSGRTIILGKDIKGQVSAEIKNQPWPQAFQAVLATQGLQAIELPGGIIRVDSPAALTALDSIEPLQTRVVRINYAPSSSLVGSVKGILTRRGSVVADTGTNSLIVSDTRSRVSEVEDFIKGLDIRTPQVSIQAKLIFVDRTDVQQLGLRYDLGDADVFFNKIVARPNPAAPGTSFDRNTVTIGGQSIAAIGNADGAITASALDLVWRTAIGGFSLTTFLSALERVDLADVQAEPLITTLDNREALINVGDDIPVRVIDNSSQGGTAGAPRATVTFKETGIKLRVTPHVTNNRQILMKLHAERS
ncbi:MAG: secretin N-terminal domain-containing protein, partial [Gemmatimonadales bacterium]